MTNILYKGLIGKEDVYWDTTGGDPATFTRRGSLGTVTITKIPDTFKLMRTVEYYGAKDDSGVTDNTTAINTALALGGELWANAPNGGFYGIKDKLSIAKAGTYFRSLTNAEIRQATSNKGGIEITVSDHAVEGLKITGPQYATQKTSEIGIYVHGASGASYITRSTIRKCEISNWGYGAILAKYVSDFDHSDNKEYNLYQFGSSHQSCGKVDAPGNANWNWINNVIGTSPTYGMTFTREDNDSLTTEPRSAYITVMGNRINNVLNYEGLDTHGGEHLTLIGNSGYGNKIAIAVGPANNTAGTNTFAPLDINIVGGEWDSGVSDGTASFGLAFSGVNGGQLATGSVGGPLRLKGYGSESAAAGCAVYTYSTDGVSFDINLIEPGTRGYYINTESYGTSIRGTIQDVWSNTNATPIAINSVSGSNTLFINDVHFVKSTKTATYSCVEAIRIGNVAGTVVRLGRNFNNGYATYLTDVGDKCNRGQIGGTVTVGTGEDDLGTTTIPANTIGKLGRIRVTAAGTKTGSGGNKTLKFHFGASSVTFHAAANNANDWRFEASVNNYATNGQTVSWIGHDGATPLQGYDTLAIDTTSDVVMKITGECADGGDVITQFVWNIDTLM